MQPWPRRGLRDAILCRVAVGSFGNLRDTLSGPWSQHRVSPSAGCQPPGKGAEWGNKVFINPMMWPFAFVFQMAMAQKKPAIIAGFAPGIEDAAS
ncbi:hypothetical protein KAM334_02570 [Aeromonas caviae]|jgi:hypothetical protein|nr:hypothetical protein C2U47_14780 [Aeromonas sp. ASNIH7]OEG07539.1 hypothetical protein BFG06_11790 [Aeromonas caviae]GJA08946.1 hypothetical protein KAM334_02570 [Aeromonas caviae]